MNGSNPHFFSSLCLGSPAKGFGLFLRLLLAVFLLVSGSCAKFIRAAEEGDALYLMYKTPYVQPRVIGIWLSPGQFLPEALPQDQLFISNLPANDIIIQVNRDVYINKLAYEDGGKALGIYLTGTPPPTGTSVNGHLIFVRRNKAERVLVAINGEPYLYTNLLPR